MNLLEYESIQESKTHGHLDFPFNIYPCSIPWDFSSVPPHWHNDMEIIYIKKGTGIITVDLVPYTAAAGDIIIVSPGQLHAIEQLKTYSMEYENIIFQLSMLTSTPGDLCTSRFLNPLLRSHLTLPLYIPVLSGHHQEISGCLDEIDDLSSRADDIYMLAIKGKLFQLLFLLLSHFDTAPQKQSASKSLDSLKVILKYVESHYHQKITIQEIAHVSGFSCSHFMKFFKQNMGISFVEYLNGYRLTMAARMLTVTSAPIVTIAGETGFENLSYFNRLFKQKYAMTPSSFRRKE